MGKPRTKYQPDLIFSPDKDGFFGMDFEPEESRFPGKGMVICSGTDGSCMFRPMSSGLFRVERKHRKECDQNERAGWAFPLKFLRDPWRVS